MMTRLLVLMSILVIELGAAIASLIGVSSFYPYRFDEAGIVACVGIVVATIAVGLLTIALFVRKSSREKINRIESKGEDVSASELCRLLDAVGLELSVFLKGEAVSSAPPSGAAYPRRSSSPAHLAVKQVPREFHKASFIDGSKAKILNWGKVPR